MSDNIKFISSITAIYANSIPSMRKPLWSELDKLTSFVQGPWILVGDFNVILNASKKGEVLLDPIVCASFSTGGFIVINFAI